MELQEIKPVPGHPDYGVSRAGDLYRLTRPKSGPYRRAPLPRLLKPNRHGFVKLGDSGESVRPRTARKWAFG